MHALMGLGLVLGLSSLPPADAEAAGSNDVDAPEQASVDLDLGGLEPIDPGVRSDLAKAIHAALVDSVRGTDLPPEKIHVDIAWQDPMAVDYAVRIHIDPHAGAGRRDLPATTGPDTSTNSLTDVISAALERALAERARELASIPPPITIVPDIVPPDEPVTPARRRPLGRVGWAGVAIAIAGVAGIAVGGGLVGLGAVAVPDDAPRLRDWRPAGYSLLALGGAAIVSGTVMAIVATKRPPSRRTALGPWGSRRGGGVALRVIF